MQSKEVMEAFFAAINRNNKEEILSFFDERSEFENVPMGTVKGVEAIWEVLAIVHERASEVNWEVHRIEAGSSGTVYTERSDRYLIDGKWAEFRCAGIHEVSAEGVITLWRDYFDLQQCLATMPE